MPEPQPLRVTRAGAVDVQAFLDERGIDLTPIEPDHGGETVEEAQERLRTAQETANRFWEPRVPTRFKEARLDSLTPQQDPRGVVSGWWASTSPTLILRSLTPGVGKSHAAFAIGYHVVALRRSARSWSAIDLNEALRPGQDETAFDVAREVDLLVIDDLGAERLTEWTIERLTSLLDHRWGNQKRTILTTNLEGKVLLDRYGSRLVDRMIDEATIVEVAGMSRRRPAPW